MKSLSPLSEISAKDTQRNSNLDEKHQFLFGNSKRQNPELSLNKDHLILNPPKSPAQRYKN